MILGSLRYLGCGFTFDDCEECTAISKEVHRTFFHEFIAFGSTTLFNRYVITPTTAKEARDHLTEFEMAGMPGCVGSWDGTHVVHERCSARLSRLHKGCKSKNPTRTFNLGVNHRRRILATTKGHPGAWNDKTLVLFDEFLTKVKSGETLEDVEFELLEESGGVVRAVTYRGVWTVVDNGYLSWAITVPPFTHTQNRKEIRWSEWIESMRKDVECTFGILKGRWRILKVGISLLDIKSVDKIWLTCCALHNMLLEEDGLDQPWDGITVPTSEWETELGNLEPEDCPAAFVRLLDPAAVRAYDNSAMGTPVAEDAGIVEERKSELGTLCSALTTDESREKFCPIAGWCRTHQRHWFLLRHPIRLRGSPPWGSPPWGPPVECTPQCCLEFDSIRPAQVLHRRHRNHSEW